ncbi:MAG: hypothetical protein J0L84_14775 [Verrucomicrobia bacterium]|nr:hypothetical protein [Verrucomicrobiota bacterium]
MQPFVEALIGEGRSVGTIRRHLNNLWLLGGEIISRSQHDRALRRLGGRELLLKFVDSEGGPLSRHLTTEAEQRGFDGMCRKLNRFLSGEEPDGGNPVGSTD